MIQQINQMNTDRLRQFTRILIGLIVLVFVIGAIALPPDPFTQIYYALPMILLSLILAYWLVYQNGYQRIRKIARE